MKKEHEKYISDLMYLVDTKDDLSQLLFDVENFTDRLGLKLRTSSEDDLDKSAIIRSELDRIGSEILQEYFKILLDENDLWLFDPAHFKGFAKDLTQDAEKVIYLNLTTAVPLNPDDIKELCERASQKLDRKVVLDTEVDETVLGGAIIKKDNYIMDFSLKTKLAKLAAEWKKSVQMAEESNG